MDTSPTHYQLAEAQLEALVGALEIAPPRAAEMRAVLSGLAAVCGDRPIDLPPRWSGLSDDCSPIEWSVAFRGGAPDVRVLVEAQADPASPMSYWSAGARLTVWLCEALGADDSLVQRVVHLFEPSEAAAYFAVFHGVEFHHDGSRRAKVYLNPAARGTPIYALAEAFDRLGLGPAWSALQPQIKGAQVVHLGLDLEREPSARVKLYLRSAAPEVLRRIGALVSECAAADIEQTLAVLCEGGQLRRAAYVVLHFAPGGSRVTTAPSRVKLDVPVPANCGTDEAAIERIARLLDHHDLDASAYRRLAVALAAIGPTAGIPLGEAYGLQTYVSFQREADDRPRVTVYFGLRAYALRYGWLALDPDTTWPTPVVGH